MKKNAGRAEATLGGAVTGMGLLPGAAVGASPGRRIRTQIGQYTGAVLGVLVANALASKVQPYMDKQLAGTSHTFHLQGAPARIMGAMAGGAAGAYLAHGEDDEERR